MNKLLGEFKDHRGLKVFLADPYHIYQQSCETVSSKTLSFDEWQAQPNRYNVYGTQIPATNTIYITTKITNPARFKQTLIHELTHAFIDYYSPTSEWDEEIVCELFSQHYAEYDLLITQVVPACITEWEAYNGFTKVGKVMSKAGVAL